MPLTEEPGLLLVGTPPIAPTPNGGLGADTDWSLSHWWDNFLHPFEQLRAYFEEGVKGEAGAAAAAGSAAGGGSAADAFKAGKEAAKGPLGAAHEQIAAASDKLSPNKVAAAVLNEVGVYVLLGLLLLVGVWGLLSASGGR